MNINNLVGPTTLTCCSRVKGSLTSAFSSCLNLLCCRMEALRHNRAQPLEIYNTQQHEHSKLPFVRDP